MIEIKITVTGLDPLTEAIATLASALAIGKGSNNPNLNKPVPEANLTTAPAVEPTPVVPTTPAPVAPPQPQTTAVPTTTRTYTIDELGAAGAQLMQTIGMPAMNELIQSFGVVSLMDLPPERYNEFAAKLREMGAQL